ncbi:MAG: hypothetical protein U0990_06045 [Candidatus Nanopelagicales bacterium]|nr:hypothetical protein [Candidatus Nanopelagicales bacterium]MDZ4249634.1 hypothetical protein [Candidatus Nanopelagicales bacterium]
MTTTLNAPASAGTHAEGVRDYVAELAPTMTCALSLGYDCLRTDVDALGADVREDHNAMRERELNDRTFEKAKKSIDALLSELAYDRGLSWSSISELVHVSVSAVRKWRHGGAATKGNRRALARIAAMLDLLEEKGIVGDPASWMEMDLPFDEDGYYVRPLDLYQQGHAVALLDIAERRKSVAQVLDEITPGWRQNRSNFEVYDDTDGQRSIRIRGH